MIAISQPLFDLRKIKKFNISLDRQINNQIWPPLEGQLQMRLIAIFNKYWTGNLEVYRFTKLWTRLIGPLSTIKDYRFDYYLSRKDVDFIEYLIAHSMEPTIH
jgi:hypothetical protein